MKIAFLILASLISVAPAFAQEQTDGQFAGSYGGGSSQYRLSPGMPYRNTEGPASVSTVGMPQTPPPFPARPVWDTQPNTGHSANFEQYVQSQPTTQVITPEQSLTIPPYNPVDASSAPTYPSTITEIASILNYEVRPRQLDFATWYLNGAQVDPKSVLDPKASAFDDAIRRFVADDIVSAWNMTMQDGFLRLIVPILLAIATWKGGEFLLTKLFSSSMNSQVRSTFYS